MNKSRNFSSIFIFALILLVFVVVLEYGSNLLSNNSNNYNVSQLQSDVAVGKIRSVIIMPNAETPTGAVRVTFSDSRRMWYFTQLM